MANDYGYRPFAARPIQALYLTWNMKISNMGYKNIPHGIRKYLWLDMKHEQDGQASTGQAAKGNAPRSSQTGARFE